MLCVEAFYKGFGYGLLANFCCFVKINKRKRVSCLDSYDDFKPYDCKR